MVSKFYGTEIEIWACFRPVGITEKNGDDYEQLLRAFFSCFYGQKSLNFVKKYYSVRTKKLHKVKVEKKYFFLKK